MKYSSKRSLYQNLIKTQQHREKFDINVPLWENIFPNNCGSPAEYG